MSEIVTLEVPDNLAARARAVAAQTHRPLEDVLIAWLAKVADDIPVTDLSDTEVLVVRPSYSDALKATEDDGRKTASRFVLRLPSSVQAVKLARTKY